VSRSHAPFTCAYRSSCGTIARSNDAWSSPGLAVGATIVSIVLAANAATAAVPLMMMFSAASTSTRAVHTHEAADCIYNVGLLDFIRTIITEDLAALKNGGRVATRFPPEPNGYLHIGHAKSICLNFGVAQEFGGTCNLRFDDTNPTKEDVEYVESIEEDVRWLGFEWAGLHFASDYFEQLYQFGEDLIQKGLAFVDSQNADEIRRTRGTLTEPGI
jgi:hypothetical protein